jgi:hypothetical protein
MRRNSDFTTLLDVLGLTPTDKWLKMNKMHGTQNVSRISPKKVNDRQIFAGLKPAESETPLIKEFVLRRFGAANWTQLGKRRLNEMPDISFHRNACLQRGG